jgi:NADH-quinone oxidoreductase subunit K
METTTLAHHLFIAGLTFSLGLVGILLRRNLIVTYMCLELLLAAAMHALVAFSRYTQTMDGAVLVFFIITVAAAEVAVGLALIVALHRRTGAISSDRLNAVRD